MGSTIFANNVPSITSEENEDIINHPTHYQSSKGFETIDVIDAFTEDLTGIEAVCTANVIKYICRWHKKNGVEDLKKARWYLDDLIRRLSAAEKQGDIYDKLD